MRSAPLFALSLHTHTHTTLFTEAVSFCDLLGISTQRKEKSCNTYLTTIMGVSRMSRFSVTESPGIGVKAGPSYFGALTRVLHKLFEPADAEKI